MRTPKIGVVTISFNQAAFLQEAIDSVRMANPAQLSYVIADAGSKDGSRGIIERNRHRFSHTILEPDRGPADGLNKGFAACNADIYGYLNSDDRFTPGALDFVAEWFETHPQFDMLHGAIRIVDERGKARPRGRAPDRFDIAKYAAGACFVWQQATFFRRELFWKTGGFNPANRVWWDAELVLDMALAGARIGCTDIALGDFRIHGESITGSGRLAELEAGERSRFRQKISEAGHRALTPRRETAAKFIYKYNPIRHSRCLFGIGMPQI